jgi:hypothetical protein
MGDVPQLKPKFGQLNSAEHSQEPESLEPENLDGLELIAKNNLETTKPKVIKKILGPFKGMVFKGTADQNTYQNRGTEPGFFSFLGDASFPKYRIFIPELHSHLPDIGEDFYNVPMTVASLYPEFIAQTTDVKPVDPGTLVWCNFLDRENFKDPVYLGPVDDKKAATGGSNSSTSAASSRKVLLPPPPLIPKLCKKALGIVLCATADKRCTGAGGSVWRRCKISPEPAANLLRLL